MLANGSMVARLLEGDHSANIAVRAGVAHQL
jgi:hypothetical protein